MNKKILWVIMAVIILGGAALAARFFIGGDEDTWLCDKDNGRWEKHGNPSGPMPTSGCGQGETSGNLPNAYYKSISSEECEKIKAEAIKLFSLQATSTVASFQDPINQRVGDACIIEMAGTGENFSSVPKTMVSLISLFKQGGWEEDFQYQANSSTGAATAFRQQEKLAILTVQWQPSSDANCSAEAPIVDCKLAPRQMIYSIFLGITEGKKEEVGMANPASTNCIAKGGQLEIKEDEGGQYGVCKFNDGSECEEWKFFRGECKIGDSKPVN